MNGAVDGEASFWCEHAWLGPGPVARGVVVDVADGRFTGVRDGVAEAPRGARALPGVTLPGLANAHSHAFHRALRGRAQGATGCRGRPAGTFWTWRDQMLDLASRLTPDTYHALARAVFAEMALAGVTTVGEFHYLHDGSNEMGDAVAAAARTAGLRITLLDTCYLHGGFDEPKRGAVRRFGDASVDAWAERADARRRSHAGNPGVRVGAAIHSVRAVRPEEARVVAAWASRNAVPLHAHVSEQPAEVDGCRAAYGTTPVGLLAEAGALGTRFCAVHATHVTSPDLDLLAASGSAVCLCPTTERDLGDGVAPARALDDHGVPFCLGTDSHAVVDLFEEARAVELDERLVTGTRALRPAADLLCAASEAGATALGWDDAGRIERGRRADLVTLSLESVRLAGAPLDALDAGVVFAAAPADVVHVLIDGRVVVEDGHHRLIDDVPGLLSRAVADLWGPAGA
ncbi:MAG: formimidoylglutamate deiminase [Acidimicrobiales bacterium]